MNTKHYNVGLTVSPTSVGYSAIDDDLHLMYLHKVGGKNAYGLRKFQEGESTEDTRMARIARRNNRRKVGRVKWLNKVLEPEINKIDPLMFDRIKQSSLSTLDDSRKFRSQIFDRPAVSAYYQRKFPTIFHVEKYLMETDDKADIRLIYMALHSLLTHRGHFNNTTPLSQFKPGKVDIESTLESLDDLFELSDFDLNIANSKKIEKIILDRHTFKKSKAKEILKNLVIPVEDKKIAKRNDGIAKQLINAFLGSSIKFDKLFLQDLDREEAKEWSFSLDDPDVENKIQNISSKLTTNQQLIIAKLQEVFASIALADILKGYTNLPDVEIASYEKHMKDLNLYRKFIDLIDKGEGKTLKDAYNLYISNSHYNLVPAKKRWGNNIPRDAESFYKVVSKIVDAVKNDRVDQNDKNSAFKYNEQIRHYADVILDQIGKKNFLPKQRTTDNVYIPWQLNALTYNKILKNQGKYYPVLVEKNPCKHDVREAPYKLSQLMQFTIPYYVGPLITEEEENEENLPQKDRFGWMIRKEKGEITPWNFYDKVDVVETANHFIQRAIAKDTYLLSYPVLPKNSMIYQKYMVYDELSNISINNSKLKGSLKQWIYENVFKKHTTVTKKTLIKELEDNNRYNKIVKVTGFSDIKHPKFNSSLSTYNSWKKVFGHIIDEPSYQNDLEKMIEWSTVFEDRKILAVKLNEIKWLNDEQKKFVINQRLTGWGRLSKKLLLGLKDHKGKSILRNMMTTRKNFVQVIHNPVYQSQIEKIAYNVTKNETLDSILDRSYTSPSNRKAIRQTIKVLDDLVELNNGAVPDKIMLRFQRSEAQKNELSISRTQWLRMKYSEVQSSKSKLYRDALSDELKNTVKDHSALTDKEYLYFQQLGRDAFSGEVIELNKLRNYRIVHIIPRSKLIDNSNNNLVLTKYNGVHKDSASKEYGTNMISSLKMTIKELWNSWNKLGLISKGKLNMLETDLNTINKYQADGFIARQLVETNQIAKLLSTILQSRFPNTKIIEVRNDMIQDVRLRFNLYRLPVVNDYFRSFDAYLTAMIGTYLYNVYPKMRRYFVFGEYLKSKKDDKEKKEDAKKFEHFNLLWQLLYGRKDSDKITANGEPLYDRKKLIDYINKVYNYKVVPVSYAVNYARGALFKATLFPRLDRDTAKSRTLISKKNGYDTAIYGGYSANQTAYMVLLEIIKSKGNEYRFIGVPVRFASELDSLDGAKREARLKEIAQAQLSNRDKFRIIKDKVPYYQLIVDGDKKFCMSSASYRYNAHQLILDSDDRKVIMDNIVDPDFTLHYPTEDAKKDLDDKLDKVYSDILYQIKHYITALHLNKFVEKLENAQPKFQKLNIGDKIEVLHQLLITTQCSPTNGKLNKIGIGSLIFQRKGNPISIDAEFIYQSPTGLQESIIPIKKFLD